jgi:ribA/ribD-fused uncharacterized protein
MKTKNYRTILSLILLTGSTFAGQIPTDREVLGFKAPLRTMKHPGTPKKGRKGGQPKTILSIDTRKAWPNAINIYSHDQSFPQQNNTNYHFFIDDTEYASVDDFYDKCKKMVETVKGDWKTTELVVMFQALSAQVATHKILQGILLNTDDKNIVAGNTDHYFGTNVSGHGENFVGQILMKIRDKIPYVQEPPMRYRRVPEALSQALEKEKADSTNPWQHYNESAQSWADISNTLKFYEKEQPYYEFANFWDKSPIIIDGLVWPSTEHYFQAMKFPEYPTIQELIRRAPTSRAAFNAAHRMDKYYDHKHWQKVGLGYMLKAIYNKFTQHDYIYEVLLGTGDKILIENTNNDWYGNGTNDKGQNWLGRILMLVRAELQKNSSPQKNTEPIEHVTPIPTKKEEDAWFFKRWYNWLFGSTKQAEQTNPVVDFWSTLAEKELIGENKTEETLLKRHLTATIGKNTVMLIKDDITQMRVQAIVNAANKNLILGEGIAGAIKKAAGPEVQKECDAIIKKNGGPLKPGMVATTGSGDLKNKQRIDFIIHAVAPDCRDPKEKQQWKSLLATTYTNILNEAAKLELVLLAIPSLGTGFFACPLEEAADIAVNQINNFLKNVYSGPLMVIFLVVFDDSMYDAYRDKLLDILAKN